jgi:hypothetical protein
MYCDLPKAEVWSYFVLWIFGVLYSLYHVYVSGSCEYYCVAKKIEFRCVDIETALCWCHFWSLTLREEYMRPGLGKGIWA